MCVYMYHKYISVHVSACVFAVCSWLSQGVHTSTCAHACEYPPVRLCLPLGQILKLCPKKKSSSTYTFCKSVGLLGMQFHLFENECKSQWAPETWQTVVGRKLRIVGWWRGQARWAGSSLMPHPLLLTARGPGLWFPDYSHGITLVTPLSGSEKKQVLHFCALGSDEMQKFVEDLKESIAEVTELEQIRIECKDTGLPRVVRWWAGRGPDARQLAGRQT